MQYEQNTLQNTFDWQPVKLQGTIVQPQDNDKYVRKLDGLMHVILASSVEGESQNCMLLQGPAKEASQLCICCNLHHQLITYKPAQQEAIQYVRVDLFCTPQD